MRKHPIATSSRDRMLAAIECGLLIGYALEVAVEGCGMPIDLDLARQHLIFKLRVEH